MIRHELRRSVELPIKRKDCSRSGRKHWPKETRSVRDSAKSFSRIENNNWQSNKTKIMWWSKRANQGSSLRSLVSQMACQVQMSKTKTRSRVRLVNWMRLWSLIWGLALRSHHPLWGRGRQAVREQMAETRPRKSSSRMWRFW